MDDEIVDETVPISASDDTGPPVDASPTDEPAAVTPPGRSRLAVAMVVAAALLLMGAVVFGVLGLQAQSEASDQRDQAVAAMHRRHELADQQDQLDGERSDLQDQMLTLPDKYFEIQDQYTALFDAHDHYVDVLGDAIDRHNSGDIDGATAVLSGDGAATIADLSAKKTATQQAVQTAQDALHKIEEKL
jgi:uncharacterized protein HemX